MLNQDKTFNGSCTSDSSPPYNPTPRINDPIEYCPYCGIKFTMDTAEIKYCPHCGKAIPRTYTGNSYIIHWNLPDGTVTYPIRDGIVRPYTIC